MKRIATTNAQERSDIFLIAGTTQNIAPGLIEKDFWVCWTLERLFALPEIAPHLLFKGGTTLSKVYNVIHRFSEDIDISVRRDFVRPDEADIAESEGISKTRRRKEIDTLVASFHRLIADVIYPSLQQAIAEQLPSEPEWQLEIDTHDPGTLYFTYPIGIPRSVLSPYKRPLVKIEFGGRSDLWPSEAGTVVPYAAESLPQAFDSPSVPVRVLTVERTFWEKATLLHSEYHRPLEKGRGDRISRHYYDLAQLSQHPTIGPRCKATRDVLQRVIAHKTIYFSDSWSRYDEAGNGMLHLVPPDVALSGLRGDYTQMRPMFLGEPPTFDAILEELAHLEKEVNGI
jgi:Nucleotidyl transferase AbiEii toxin, Type IV TA system